MANSSPKFRQIPIDSHTLRCMKPGSSGGSRILKRGGFQCARDWSHKAHEVSAQVMCGMWGHVPPGFQTFWDRFGVKQQEHRRRKQIWSVEAMLHRTKCGARRKIFLKVCTFRLPFLQMYKLSDLPNRPVKYLENCKIERTDFVVVPSPAFVACSSHCENVH